MFHCLCCPCCFCFGAPYGNDDIDDLCSLFIQAGCWTWRTLGDSYNLGFEVREDSIVLLLQLLEIFPPWQGGPGKYESPHWGCAVAHEESVRRLLSSPTTNVNRISCIGPISVPWMCLVCPAIRPIAVEGNFPELVRRRAMQAFNLSSAPSVRAVPEDFLDLLHMSRMALSEANVSWAEEFSFLEGIVVVSDQPFEQ